MVRLSLVVLGGALRRVPRGVEVIAPPLCAPNPQSLYEARLDAVLSARTECVSVVDGGPDEILPGYETAMGELCADLDEQGADIGSCRFEIGHSGRTAYMRHAVVLRTAALQAVQWPRGLYRFESVVYEKLRTRGVALHPSVVYRWHASPGGAHTWPDMAAARVNSWRWLSGRAPLPESRPPSRRP